MKRQCPEIFEGMTSSEEMKRSRSVYKVEVRILIPSKTAGSIIGRGGANIQQLRKSNNAILRVPDNEGPERVMTIQVEDNQSAISVIEQSLPFMMEDDGTNSATRENQYASSRPQEIRLLIHESIVGGIIGKGGSTIHKIEKESRAKVHAFGTCAPQSTDRCVAVRGTTEEIIAALAHIIPFVSSRDQEDRQGYERYDPNNFDCFYAQEYGGYGTPRDVEGFNELPMPSGARGMQYPGRPMYNGASGYFPPQAMIGNDGFGNGMPNFGSNFVKEEEDIGPITTSKVTIPKDMGGAILGPGGSRIRKVRMDSKADIKLGEPEEGTDERIITITGTPQRIQAAQYLLQQCIREFGRPAGRNVW